MISTFPSSYQRCSAYFTRNDTFEIFQIQYDFDISFTIHHLNNNVNDTPSPRDIILLNSALNASEYFLINSEDPSCGDAS